MSDYSTYNVDQSEMPLEHRQPRRVAEKGTKKCMGDLLGTKHKLQL